MKVTKTYTVEQEGVGKPDYSREVHAGRERAGMALKYNQRFRVFVGGWGISEPLYPLCTPYSIAVGGKDHLHDSDTNLALPVTIPAGFTLTMIAEGIFTSQDVDLYLFTDSIVCTSIGGAPGGISVYENKIREFSTIWYDPTAALPHTLDILAYNRGGDVLNGGIAILCIQEAVGTPPWPNTKDCMCPHCQHVQNVSIETTRITCEKCGKLYMVTSFASLREL